MIREIKLKIDATFALIEKYVWAFLIICTPIVTIYEVFRIFIYKLSIWYGFYNYEYIILLTNFIYNGFYLALLIFLIHLMYENKKSSINDLFLFIKQNWWGIALIVLVIQILTNIGLFLLILPGVYIFSRLVVAPYLFSIDGYKIYNSFRLSFIYSTEHIWTLFLTTIFLSIPVIPLIIIKRFVPSQILVSIITILMQLYYITGVVLYYLFYLEIKEHMIKDLQNNK